MAIVLASSIAFSKQPLLGLYGLIKLLEFVFLGWYIGRFPSKTAWRIAGSAFAVGMIFEGLLAFAQFQAQSSVGGVFYLFGERTFSSSTPGIANASLSGQLILRSYGTLPHPNVLAGYMLLGMFIVYGSLSFVKNKTVRMFFLSAIIIGSIALFLTMSRVAILLWVVMLMFWIRKFFLIFVLVCIGSILFFSPLRFRLTDFSLRDESVVARQEMIEQSVLMIKQHLFFGAGINNYLHNLPSQQITALFTHLQPVHNIYLLIAAETGILGFVIGIYWVGLLMRKTIRAKIPQRNILLIMLFTIFVIGLFDHYFWTVQQGRMMLAVVLGLAWGTVRSV